MSVYVDDMEAPFGRMVMNHMYADTLAELHEMADKIGVTRKWFQNKAGHPHYDIALSKKTLAIQAGAVQIEYWSGHMSAFEGEGYVPSRYAKRRYQEYMAAKDATPAPGEPS